MNHKKIRGSLVVITCFVALGLFFLIFSFWNETKYEQPLSEYLDNQKYVTVYEIKEFDSNDYYIEIELKYHSYLNETVLEIENKLEEILEDKKWEIVFKYDEDNENLQQAFYNIHFVLFEAKERGNYREMYAEVDEILKDHNVNHYQIHILTDERILVQMKDDDGFLIYMLNDDSDDSNRGRA